LGTNLDNSGSKTTAMVGQHRGKAKGRRHSRRKAIALFSVSSSWTARCTERERRSIAT
jgi:hypothetical protein